MGKKIDSKAEKLGIGDIKHHIFLCAEPSSDKCCKREEGLESWMHLKKKVAQNKLSGKGGVFITKANCLKLCDKGPIAVVYPEGIWYHSVTPKVIDKIIEKHIFEGKPLKKNQIKK